MPQSLLTEATTKDAGIISDLASIIWNQHYPSIIGQKQVDYMLQLMYSHKSLLEQMSSKQHRFFLIHAEGKTQGFISVNKTQGNDWFLNKFYINQQTSAKGLGTASFQSLLNLIEPKKITLTCNRQNYKTINFYFKLGFKIENVADFDIGNGFVMNDFIMVWERK